MDLYDLLLSVGYCVLLVACCWLAYGQGFIDGRDDFDRRAVRRPVRRGVLAGLSRRGLAGRR